MSNRTQDELEHDSAFNMLPWYVNETLEPSERTAVSRHIEQCSECRNEVEFLAAMNEHVQVDARDRLSEHGDVEGNLTDVLGRIDAEAPQPKQSEGMRWHESLKRYVLGMFAFPPTTGVQWGAAGLAGVLVAVLAVTTFVSQPGDDYSVLSSGDDAPPTMRIAVTFVPSTSQLRAESLLESTFAERSLAAGIEKESDGLYLITIDEPMSVDDLNIVFTELTRDESVSDATVLSSPDD